MQTVYTSVTVTRSKWKCLLLTTTLKQEKKGKNLGFYYSTAELFFFHFLFPIWIKLCHRSQESLICLNKQYDTYQPARAIWHWFLVFLFVEQANYILYSLNKPIHVISSKIFICGGKFHHTTWWSVFRKWKHFWLLEGEGDDLSVRGVATCTFVVLSLP